MLPSQEIGIYGPLREKDQRSLFECCVGKVGENGRLPFPTPSPVKAAEKPQSMKRKPGRPRKYPKPQESPKEPADDFTESQTGDEAGLSQTPGKRRKYLEAKELIVRVAKDCRASASQAAHQLMQNHSQALPAGISLKELEAHIHQWQAAESQKQTAVEVESTSQSALRGRTPALDQECMLRIKEMICNRVRRCFLWRMQDLTMLTCLPRPARLLHFRAPAF